MPRIDYKEARSIGLATLEDEEAHRVNPDKLSFWDICISCWGDNQLDGDLEHPDYDTVIYKCLVCNRKLEGGSDNHPYTKEGDRAIERFTEKLKKDAAIIRGSQPDQPLTELEEYCLKLDNDIKAFKITIAQNARETERLLISTKVAVAAIEATQTVLDRHRGELV